VPLLRSLVPQGGRTLVGGPIGFTSGGHMTAIKAAEAAALREARADELDMMLNVDRLKSGDSTMSATRSPRCLRSWFPYG
jgi:deoxyribose-phosphate aldolase